MGLRLMKFQVSQEIFLHAAGYSSAERFNTAKAMNCFEMLLLPSDNQPKSQFPPSPGSLGSSTPRLQFSPGGESHPPNIRKPSILRRLKCKSQEKKKNFLNHFSPYPSSIKGRVAASYSKTRLAGFVKSSENKHEHKALITSGHLDSFFFLYNLECYQ